MQARQQRLKYPALLFQGADAGQVELKLTGGDQHSAILAQEAGAYNAGMRRDSVFAVFVVSALVILALTGYGVVRAVQRLTEPAVSASGQVGTQVAGVSTEVAAFLHPTPTVYPDPVTVVLEIRSLARLETAQYTVEKVITAESGQGAFGFLFGDRLLFVAHGQVLAGVDLSKLVTGDLTVDADGRVTVVMPPAEVFVTALDNEKSYVYDRETGILTRGNVDLETAARRVAEDEIETAALEDGILELAERNARDYLERLLRAMGYREVVFVDATPIP